MTGKVKVINEHGKWVLQRTCFYRYSYKKRCNI